MALSVIFSLLIRHLLTATGGGAFIEGLLTGDTINQIGGAIAAIVGVAASIHDKKKN